MNKVDLLLNKYYKKIFWCVSSISLILYILILFGDYIWADESYSLAIIKHSFSEIWKITAADVHPPLYYFYLKIITMPFHYSLVMAKIASILPYMFIIVWGGNQIKVLINKRTSIIFMILFFFYPFTMDHAIEIRMYSLAAVFVFSCAIFAYRTYHNYYKINDIIGLVISGVLSAYTHYFAFVSICIIYAILLVSMFIASKVMIKKWLIAVISSIILYLPWMTSFYQQLAEKVHNEYWIQPITIKTIGGYINELLCSRYAWFLGIGFISCIVLACIINSNKIKGLCLCCLLIPFGTLLIGVTISLLIRPIFMIRYLTPSVPLFVVFIAIVLGHITNIIISCILLCCLLIPGIFHYKYLFNYQIIVYNQVFNKDYPDTDAYLVVGYTHIASTLCYYVDDIPVYCTMDVSPAACPYGNMSELIEYDITTTNKVIMLWDGVAELPKEYAQLYELYDITSIGTWICEIPVEAYILTPKQ